MRTLGIIAAATLCSLASAQAQTANGLLTSTAGAVWAKFDAPVKIGETAVIRPHRSAEKWGQARIKWCSALPPYEALLVDLRQTRTSGSIQTTTRYQRIVEARGALPTDTLPDITAGFTVTAPAQPAGAAPKAVHPLRAALAAVLDRTEVRDALGDAGVSYNAADAEQVLAALKPIRFTDPVTVKLIARLRELHLSVQGVKGDAPAGFFPPDLARQKTETTRTTP
jgi:hypothetical protein